MSFHSPVFLFLFLPSTLLITFLLSSRGQKQYAVVFLIASSLVFYGWLNPPYVLLILSSIAVNYYSGLVLSGKRVTVNRKLIFIITVAGNLLLLGYFKYTDFFIGNLNSLAGLSFHMRNIILPLGISFFTFQQLAYIIDVYRGESGERNFFDYCLFVAFFPKLIAGPIVYKKEFFPQLSHEGVFRFNQENVSDGLTIFLLGLFKKVAIADILGTFADPVFHAARSGDPQALSFFVAWQGGLAYSLQIYFDFSAYSDMAVGLARVMGITLPVNFNSPYKAVNVSDFWGRWHITLSRFLRNYIYIPLGGNRKGEARRSLNLIATMLLCGLWHGAGWTFIVWGAMHAGYLVIYHAWKKMKQSFGGAAVPARWWGIWTARSITFLAITAGWVVFRAESLSSAAVVLRGMAGINGAVLPAQILNLVPPLKSIVKSAGSVHLLGGGTVMGFIDFLLITITCATIAFFSKNLYELSLRWRIYLLVPTFAFVLQSVLFGQAASDFIYFRF